MHNVSRWVRRNLPPPLPSPVVECLQVIFGEVLPYVQLCGTGVTFERDGEVINTCRRRKKRNQTPISTRDTLLEDRERRNTPPGLENGVTFLRNDVNHVVLLVSCRH